MIDNCLGIDTEGGGGGGGWGSWVGDTEHHGFCHIMRHAVMLFFLTVSTP